MILPSTTRSTAGGMQNTESSFAAAKGRNVGNPTSACGANDLNLTLGISCWSTPREIVRLGLRHKVGYRHRREQAHIDAVSSGVSLTWN